MPLDPIIAQGVTPIGADVPNTLMRIQALRASQQENQLRALQTQQVQEHMQRAAAIRGVMGNPNATVENYLAQGPEGAAAYSETVNARMAGYHQDMFQQYVGLRKLQTGLQAAAADPEHAHDILEPVKQYSHLIGWDPNADISKLPPQHLAELGARVAPQIDALINSSIPLDKQAEYNQQWQLERARQEGQNVRTGAEIQARAQQGAAQRGSEQAIAGARIASERDLAERRFAIEAPQQYQARVTPLRDSYIKILNDNKIPESQGAYARLTAAASDPSGASDLALYASYMKIIDPNMTLRPGMLANAENSGSVSQKIQARYNRIVNGERMSASERAETVAAASNAYAQTAKQVKAIQGDFTAKAKGAGVKPEDVLIDTGAPVAPGQVGQGPGRSPSGYQPGQTFQHPSGATVQILPNP